MADDRATTAIHWPQSLLDGAVFPHPVHRLQLIETHISWVVLTGDFAYKIKKPVDLGFADFSSLARRRHFCERELELNRRYSDNLYLDVVPITGTPRQPRVGGDGEVIDYAVRMRQFDTDRLVGKLATSGDLDDGLVDAMATLLARLHREFPALDAGASAPAIDAFQGAVRQNFAQLADYPLGDGVDQTLAACEGWMNAALQHCRPLIEQRRQQGFIKDCHGDCHLDNIAVIDGQVTLFDCIEFNDSFRVMDTLAEAAFLDMDLHARQLTGQAHRFLNRYLEAGGDYAGLPLLNLFRCHYALVRAKVNLLAHPAAGHPPVSAASHPEFFRYVNLAEGFTRQRTPALVVMHGLSGSGKSWLAEWMAVRSGAIRIRSDVERKRLFNLDPLVSGASVPDLYGRDASRRTFARLLALAQGIVAAGFTCIVDATFLSRASRRPFVDWAREQGIALFIVSCHAPEAVILERLGRRTAQGGDPSDADAQVYRRQKPLAEVFDGDEAPFVVRVDTASRASIEGALGLLPTGG